jgi:hypothetical protein
VVSSVPGARASAARGRRNTGSANRHHRVMSLTLRPRTEGRRTGHWFGRHGSDRGVVDAGVSRRTEEARLLAAPCPCFPAYFTEAEAAGDPRRLRAAWRAVGRGRAAPAVPWHHRQRAGAGVRPDHRRLEAVGSAASAVGGSDAKSAAVTAGALTRAAALSAPGWRCARSGSRREVEKATG